MVSPADDPPPNSSPDSLPVSPRDPGRRRALRAGGGALALVLGGGAGWLDRRDDHSPAPPTTTTSTTTTTTTLPAPTFDAGTFADTDPGILTVGARYVATHPDDADLATLVAALPSVDDNPLAAAAARVAADFRAGDTVVVDGWVLARSEARAAAIIALACGGGAC